VSEKIEACPFDGSPGELYEHNLKTCSGHYTAVVQCPSCSNVSGEQAYGTTPEEARNEAILFWNRRAKPEPGPATKAIMEMLGTAAGGRDERLSITIECGGYEEYLGIDMINAFLREQGEPS
jgi:hypothetical protein